MGRNYLALPYECAEETAMLDDAAFGRLVRALLVYGSTGEVVPLEGDERFIFPRMRMQEDRYQKNYTELREKRSLAGKKGMESRWGKTEQPQPVASDNNAITNDSENNHTKTKTNTNTKTNSNISICAASVPDVPPVYTLPLVDKTEWGVSQKLIDEWSDAYPAVDVLGELKKMRVWLNDNPTRKKTKRGIRRFVSAWLDREQDRGRNVYSAGRKATAAPRYIPQGTDYSLESNRKNFDQMQVMLQKMRGDDA